MIAGIALGALTFAVYMVGSNRNFGYDAAATFTNFVATPSLRDAFAIRSVVPTIPVTQVATNDHVLLSLLSHVIFSVSGSRTEAVYRVIPALAAAVTVGLSTEVMSRRFGLLAGVCAGVFIATDPLFVDNSRDLRGYSLAALGSVVATLILAGKWTRWRLVAYAVVMGLAITAQLSVHRHPRNRVVITRRPRRTRLDTETMLPVEHRRRQPINVQRQLISLLSRM